MRRRRLPLVRWLLLSSACGRPETEGWVSCAADPANPTLGGCQVALAVPGEFAIELTDGEETVQFSAEIAAGGVNVPLWGLVAGEEWQWTALDGPRVAQGTFESGDLPMEVGVEVSGAAPSTLVQVLVPYDCAPGAFATVLDAGGRVRWTADSGRRDIDMAQFTEAGTVVLIADKSAVVEIDLLGRFLLDRDDFDLPLHHDVFRRGDRIYTFLANAWTEGDGLSYVEDIVVALDLAGNEQWRWDEHGALDATLAEPNTSAFWSSRFPGSIDAWHSNALFPTETGDVLVSLRRESTVVRVSGADQSIAWVLAGDGVGRVFPSDFSLVDGAGAAAFGGQHHVALLPDGHLTVFDNDHARGLELALDPGAGTATWVGEWPVDAPCEIQSSVFPLEGGHRLVTCATRHELTEFDETGTPGRRLVLSCPDGAPVPRTARGQPIDLWADVTVDGVRATRIR